ncbi:MAG: hypothetical protein ACI9K2_007140 [Myxococcota bacterium]|jgi:hypothetical protein
MRPPLWRNALVLSVLFSVAIVAATQDAAAAAPPPLTAEEKDDAREALAVAESILEEVDTAQKHLAKANTLLASRKLFKRASARGRLRNAGRAIARLDANAVGATLGSELVAAVNELASARKALESIKLDGTFTEEQLKEVRDTVDGVLDQSEVVADSARKLRYALADLAGGGDEDRLGGAGRMVAHDETWERYCEGTLRPHDAFDGGSDGKDRFWRWGRGSAGTWVVCVDARGDRVYVGPSTRNEWVHPLPHQRLELVVRSDEGEQVEIDRDGVTGIYVAGVDVSAGDVEEETGQESVGGSSPEERAAPPQVIEHVQVKETFKPGPLTLGVSVDGVDPGGFPDEVEALADGLDALAKALKSASAALTKAAEAVEVPETPAETKKVKQGEKDGLAARATAASELAGKAEGRADVLELLADQLDALPAVDRTWLTEQDAAVAALTTTASSHTKILDAAKADDSATLEEAGLLLDAAGGALTLLAGAESRGTALASPLSPKTDSVALEVEATYTGAIRPGVSLLFPSVSSTTWKAGKHPLGPTDEDVVLVTDRGNVNVEFVIGYSQYFHRRPVSKSSPRPALNFGVGVVSLEDGQVSALRSVYLGPEWGWPNLSMALAGVVRRVPKLQQGVVEGAAVFDATNLTVDTWTVGLGLIIYPSPELWKTSFGKSN